MSRWLLACYPRAYRRDRGPEILETIEVYAGTARPWRIAANLIRHGLRTRLGRPVSRTVVVWAVLFTVACGLFAASFGSWAGWQTIRPLHHAEAVAVVAELLPAAGIQVDPADPPAPFVIYGQPLNRQGLHSLLFGDGGEYQLGAIDGNADGPPRNLDADLATLLGNLRRGGWRFDVQDHPAPDSYREIRAGRGDQSLDVTMFYNNSTGTSVDVVLTRPAPPLAVAGGVLGLLAGLAGGFLLFGWASRRSRGIAVKLLFAPGLFLWSAPTALVFPPHLVYHLQQWHYSWDPLWEWLGQPDLSLLFLVGTVFLLAAFGVAAAQRGPAGSQLTTPAAG